MRAEKEELMKKFDVIQKTGKIPPELMEKIGKDRLDSLNNTKNDGATEDYKDSTIKKPVKEPKKDAFKPKPQIKRIEPKKEVVPEKSLSNVDQQNASLKKQSEKQDEVKKSKKDNEKKLKTMDKSKELEDLKMQQNAELLELLNTEQKIEEEREKMLEKVTETEERKRLERIFGIERAKASERIIKLSEKHEKALQNLQKRIK